MNEEPTFGSKQGFTQELGKKPLFCVCISFPCYEKTAEVHQQSSESEK